VRVVCDDQPPECYGPPDVEEPDDLENDDTFDGISYYAEIRYEEARAYRANRAIQFFNLRRVLNRRTTLSSLPHRRGRAPRRHVRGVRRRTVASARSPGRQADDPELASRRPSREGAP
jgi:hypothetical protein